MILDGKPPRFRAQHDRALHLHLAVLLGVVSARRSGARLARERASACSRSGEALLVFPEGVKGICKTLRRRYKLAPFGPGFMRLALETKRRSCRWR